MRPFAFNLSRGLLDERFQTQAAQHLSAQRHEVPGSRAFSVVLEDRLALRARLFELDRGADGRIKGFRAEFLLDAAEHGPMNLLAAVVHVEQDPENVEVFVVGLDLADQVFH